MLLYHIYDWQHAVLTPFRLAAEATQAAFQNPFVPVAYTQVGRAIAASAEMFERSTRQFTKPDFNLTSVKLRGQVLQVEEEVVATKPFCRLLHFRRISTSPEIAQLISHDPTVLIVAPLSGQHATLLRNTVEAMLPEHDVYITDWTDAKMVPLSQGKFDLEDNITYIMDFIRQLGPNVHVMAVCQPSVPVLCAVSLLADMDDPVQPRSMILMGGPIDTRKAKTIVCDIAESHTLDWFRNTMIHAIPFYYPGAYRLVFPGFLQLQGFMSMHIERHIGEHFKMFLNLVRGNGEEAEVHRKFYDEYFSAMDVTSEFYLQTVERVYQNCDLPNGTFRWHDRLVKPQAVKRTALLTVEGELDDISAPGQTQAAHTLCSGLPPGMKQAHLEIGVGHYSVFYGRRWRNNIQPVVQNFIRAHFGHTTV